MWSQPSSLILGAWVLLGLSFIGLGLLVCRRARADLGGADGWLLAFWIGWATTLFVLQVWHLFLPVDARALALIVGMGLSGLVLALVSGPRPSIRLRPGHVLPLFFLLLGVLYFANRALGGPQHGDSGAYFIPTTRWFADYPIVPGLANLYVPFAFNQSYFLYVAMLDVGPFARGSYHLANGLLVLALFARGLLGLARLVRWRRPCEPADVFYALFLPVIVQAGLSIFLTSPSPDLALFLVGVVVSGHLITQVTRTEPRPAPLFDVLAIALLATAGVTVKLSFAGLAAAIIPSALLVHLRRSGWRRSVPTVLALGAVVLCGMGPWVIRNVLMSGCPFYPSALGALPVEWRVRADAVEWIMAPMHFGAPFWFVFREPRWFYTRLDSLGWISSDVLVPTGIALATLLVGLVVWLVRLVRRRPRATPRLPLLILLPALVSFLFVSKSAPMPRYMGATFWLIAVQGVLLLLGRAAFGKGTARRLAAAVVVVVATAALLAQKRPFFHEGPQFDTGPTPPVTQTRLESGLVVGVPQTNQCWDLPLPCSPFPDPLLRLRRANDLGSGFVIDGPS